MSSKNKNVLWISSFVFGFLVCVVSPAMASERLCDASFEDCRAPLVALIQKENVEIDIAFWFMDDYMISGALASKIQNQPWVKIRMLVDPRSDSADSDIPTYADQMQPLNTNINFNSKKDILPGQSVME